MQSISNGASFELRRMAKGQAVEIGKEVEKAIKRVLSDAVIWIHTDPRFPSDKKIEITWTH